MKNDSIHAFCDHIDLLISGNSKGSLAGLTFAAKDLFDVRGHTCCVGNPTWLATHPPATHTAPPIQMLLDAGATLIGKTKMDELAFSMSGKNKHYGMPINSAAPTRIPGGSSSGSATAVAGELVDFALGTDTTGSIRTPASYCGLYGIRPTHGLISTEHMAALAPSFDTVGWFTRNSTLLQKIGNVLLPESTKAQLPKHLYIATDALDLIEPTCREAIAIGIAKITAQMPPVRQINLSNNSLENWLQIEASIKYYEAWQHDGAWITANQPNFAPDVAQRFTKAATITTAEFNIALQKRIQIQHYLHELLNTDAILCIPTTPSIAPLISSTDAELETIRKRTIMLMVIANLGGLPQVTLPITDFNGAPLGISLIAGPRQDATLLALAQLFSK